MSSLNPPFRPSQLPLGPVSCESGRTVQVGTSLLRGSPHQVSPVMVPKQGLLADTRFPRTNLLAFAHVVAPIGKSPPSGNLCISKVSSFLRTQLHETSLWKPFPVAPICGPSVCSSVTDPPLSVSE